jgi:pSer/pThr/pTyr-binding forkhead associated (FHA) protein
MIMVGRAPNNDIVLNHPSVSKVHAYFVQRDLRWSVHDQGSTNGTFLDALRVGTAGAVVTEGCQIAFGMKLWFRFQGGPALHASLRR